MRTVVLLILVGLFLLVGMIVSAQPGIPSFPPFVGTPTWAAPAYDFPTVNPERFILTAEPVLPEADVPRFVIAPLESVPVFVIEPLQQLLQIACYVITAALNG